MISSHSTLVDAMSSVSVSVESEAGRLQADLREMFRKMLTHTKRIDSSMTLGTAVEALGQLRELEAYLEWGLVVLCRPLVDEPPP